MRLGKDKIITVIVLLIFALFTAFFISYRNIVNNKRKHNFSLASGKITSYVTSGNGSVAWFYYEYIINDTTYKGRNATKPIKEKVADVFMSKSFPVAYESDSYNNSGLLIIPKDFAEYGVQFPDSLSWVMAYYDSN